MALQSSGAISISQIRTELGSASGSLRTLSSLAGKSTPDAMSEFYGYSSVQKIYWDGNFTAGASGLGASGYFYAANYQPVYGDIFFIIGDGAWSFGTDPTAGWDGYVHDHAVASSQAVNNFYFPCITASGSENVYIYLTPPSGRSLVSPSINESGVTYTYYDLSASVFNVSYYGAGSTNPILDFFFYLQ